MRLQCGYWNNLTKTTAEKKKKNQTARWNVTKVTYILSVQRDVFVPDIVGEVDAGRII